MRFVWLLVTGATALMHALIYALIYVLIDVLIHAVNTALP